MLTVLLAGGGVVQVELGVVWQEGGGVLVAKGRDGETWRFTRGELAAWKLELGELAEPARKPIGF